MPHVIQKINITLSTYRHAALAIKRQYNPEKISKTQNQKLRMLIKYAYRNIKYYRELFDRAGLKPGDIKTKKDLTKIPILTKDQLRQRFWDFLPHNLPVSRVSRTSGSTGIPLCILTDNHSKIFNSAAVIRYRKALSIPIIGSTILTPLKTENEPFKKPHWTFLQGIHKTYYFNPYIDSSKNTEYTSRLLKKLKSPALIGITPAIKTLAYKIKDGRLPKFKPKAVLTTGQFLNTKLRNFLENTFHKKINDIYACNEAGDIAWQCQKGTYHINAENCIVEILKENKTAKQNQLGEVTITNLNRLSMPIIRYKNADLAILSNKTCPCGCKLPAIEKIAGRTGQDIILRNGKTIPWNQLKSLMNHPLIRQFQLIQNRDSSLTIKYIPETKTDNTRLENLLLYRFEKLLHASINIHTKKVKKIPPTPGGKTKLVICKLNQSNPSSE